MFGCCTAAGSGERSEVIKVVTAEAVEAVPETPPSEPTTPLKAEVAEEEAFSPTAYAYDVYNSIPNPFSPAEATK